MKIIIAVTAGIILGVVFGIAFYPQMMIAAEKTADPDKIEPEEAFESRSEILQETNRHPRGITLNEADNMFYNYHGTRIPSESNGLLKVMIDGNQEAVTHFYLDYELVVDSLIKKVAAARDTTLVGFAGILAFDVNDDSHTMMWVAVVEKNDSLFYYLPSKSDQMNKTYIYDYVDVCPKACPENYDRLWTENWAE